LETVPDSVFVKEDGQSDEDAAEYLLSLGKTWKGLNQLKKSRTVLLGLVERYPGSKAAGKAIALLDTMRESPRLDAK
jgi:TolA-binding protein